MPIDEALAEALDDLALESLEGIDGKRDLEDSLTLSHGITEVGASGSCTCCVCSCAGCSCCCC